MYLLTGKDIKQIDAYNEEIGLSPSTLMRIFAGRIAERVFSLKLSFKRVLIVAGPGNNGGDGLAVARLLIRKNYRVDILMPIDSTTDTARLYKDLAVREGIRFFDHPTQVDADGYGLIIDALFGIGLHRDVQGTCADCIMLMNRAVTTILSVDIPSGLNDAGMPCPMAVKADYTVTACGMKTGLLFGEAPDYVGEVSVVDIENLFPRSDYPLYVQRVAFPQRKKVSHKGTYSDVWILAGSVRYPGAGLMAFEACRAALGAGAGRARLAVVRQNRPIYAARIQEEILIDAPEQDGVLTYDPEWLALIPTHAVVVLGSGGGQNVEIRKIAVFLAERELTLILDADAINQIGDLGFLQHAKASIIFTPHIKEFSRLSGETVEHILADPILLAQRFAKQYGVTLLLKSNYSIATDGQKTMVTAEGTPALAKAGSGDVLAGVLAAMIGQRDNVSAAISAAVLCGHAAKRKQRETGEVALLASDVIQQIACITKQSD